MSAKSGVIARDEWRSHGHIIPACLVGIMLVAVHNYALGVMIRPLEQEFGWSRAQISIGPLIPSLASIFIAPLVGVAIDRHGARRIALLGIPLFSGTLALLSTATSDIVTWWALYTLVGVATMFVFPMVWTASINRRFVRNRGLALAIALSGTGITAAIMPTLATWLLELHGWRGAYVGLGLLCFLVAFPITYFLFDRRGAPSPTVVTQGTRSADRAATRGHMLSSRYITLLAAAFVYSVALSALTSNSVPILLSEGFDALTAAAIAGSIGIGTIFGRLGGGLLLDRFEGRYVVAGSVVAPIATAIILLATQGSEWGATIGCVMLGFAAGAEYDGCAYLTARYFGTQNFGTLFGLIAAIVVFANGIAPAASNYVFDLVRSYDPVLWLLLPLFLLSAVLFMALGKYPEEVEAAHP